MDTRQGLQWIAGDRTPPKVYLTRVINFGTWEEWQDVKRRFSPDQIREALIRPLKGQWTKRGRAFAEAIFDCKIGDEALISYDV